MAFRISIELFNLATMGFFIATILYVFYFVTKNKKIYMIAPIIVAAALACQTGGLGIRWFLGGFYRPPWTNLYESLVFFSWGLAVFALWCDYKYKMRAVGTFIYPLVFSAMALAFVTPDKGINPLVPALQSWWLLAHACLAAFAYAGFMTGAVFALFYLVKTGVPLHTFGTAFSLFGFLSILLVGGKKAIFSLVYQMTEYIQAGGRWYPRMVPHTDPAEYFKVVITWAGPLFVLTAIAYIVSLFLFQSGRKNPIKAFKVALGLHLLLVADIFYHIITLPNVKFASNPYAVILLMLTAAISGFFVYLFYHHKSLTETLPPPARLDELSYKMTVFAFPFMTLIIITGAVWAHEAWGRYWGWDPKETTSLITWFIYAAYLHARHIANWSGRKAAVLLLVGFVSVIFTYLGANLILSGLHSYGAN